jgi:hypothetical protein
MHARTHPIDGDAPSSDRGSLASGRALAVADAIALLAFVAVGLRSHRIGAIAEIAVRNLVPLTVAWIVVALVVGTYRRRDLLSLVLTWMVAVPTALLVRTWWVGSPQGGRIAVFLGVGMAFTLLFLLIGRGLVAALTRTRPAWRRP